MSPVLLNKVDEVTDEQWETPDHSDAIVFGSPTYMDTQVPWSRTA